MTGIGKAPAAPTSCALLATPALHPAPCVCVRLTARPLVERNLRRQAGTLQALPAVAAGAAGAAAASSGTLQAAVQQQLEEAPSPGRLTVDAEYIFSVEGCCTLRVHSRLDGSDAQRAAALAAALVALRRREQGLNAAVQAACEHLPGVLDSKLLEKFGRLRAAGRSDAAMAVLGPSELLELCSRVAPQACKEVEEALVARAVQLQAAQLDPPPAPGPPFQLPAALSGSSGGSGGASPRPEEFRLRQWYDLPLDLTAQPQWEGWVRRLRGELIAWQRRQQQQQRQQQEAQQQQLGAGQEQAAAASPAGTAQPAGTPSSASNGAAAGAGPAGAAQASGAGSAAAPAAGAAQGAARGVVSASFAAVGVSPDGLGMRTELAIRVQPPEGRRLVGAVEQSGFGGLAAAGFDLGPALLALDTTPEPLLQHALEVAALGSVRLPLDSLAFACTLHQAGEQAPSGGASAGDAAAAAGGGGGGFHFKGSALDLFAMLATVSWMASGGEDGLSQPDSSAWVPADGRIRFQRRGADDAGRWRLPWGQRQPGAADTSEASYRLQVWPQPGPAGGDQQPSAQHAQQPAEVALSQRQLDGLMDCLDGLLMQHPGYAGAPPLSPLAVPPTAAQQAAGWVRERLGGGT